MSVKKWDGQNKIDNELLPLGRLELGGWFGMSTQVADEYMQHMPNSALRLYLALYRKIIGWHKQEDAISYSQFGKMT